MIRINLLGDSTVVDATAKVWLAGYIASVVLSLGLGIFVYTSWNAEVSELTKEQSDLQAQLDGLLKQTKTVRELEQKKARLTEKLRLIATLKKSKVGPVRVLDDLNMALPEQVWLRGISEKGGKLKIKGRALANQDIAQFMQKLESSDYFADVDLEESRQMYYSKRTGMVRPTADVSSFRKSDFQADSRASKESSRKAGTAEGRKWGIKRTPAPNGNTRKAQVDEANVKIKEFVLSATVKYAGNLQISDTAKE